MTKPVPPWEPGTRQTTIAPAKPRRRHAPASEAHKRGLTLDWLSTTPDARPALLRRIVGAEYNSRYTGRTAILDEVADAAYESAEDKDDLDGLLTTIAADLQARKDGAALLNKETPPGVRAGIIAKRYQLGKTEPVRFGGEQTVPRDNKSPRQPELVPDAPKPALTGGLFGTKPADPQDNIDTFEAPNPEILKAGMDIAHGTPAEREAAREQLAPAVDTDKATLEAPELVRNHILKHIAEHYGLNRDAKGQEAFELGKRVQKVFGKTLDQVVPKMIASCADADAAMQAYWQNESTPASKPESQPKPEAEPERVIDAQTGEITSAPKPAAMTVYQPQTPALLPEQVHWTTMREQAAILIKSGFLPQSIRTPEQAIALMMMGEALNVKPIIALQSINVIQGKPTVSPQLMLALIRKSGQLQDLTVTDDGSTCKVVMTRKGETPHTETFSMTDAGAMGLAGKDNWKKQPAVMRKWRAISAACRVVFPDIILGFYTPEEINPDVVVDDAA